MGFELGDGEVAFPELRSWKPCGLAWPHPKEVSSGYSDSWMLRFVLT
jgi:hypothetical protein